MPHNKPDAGGNCLTGKLRIRSRIFGCVLEEQVVDSWTGESRWRTRRTPFYLKEQAAVGYILGLHEWCTGKLRIRNGLLGLRLEEQVHTPGVPNSARWKRYPKPWKIEDLEE